jgi:LysM repeat protein
LRKWRGTVNNFRRSGKTRAPRRKGFNFTRRRGIQRRFQARANEQKQFNKPWNLPRENFAAKQSKPPRRKDANRAKKMNNPNPFVPQGSVLEQNKRRSRMKLAVFCVLAVSVCGLTAMLIQGCKREQSTENLPPVETNNYVMDTNPPPVSTNPPVVMPPVETNPPVVVTPPPISQPGTEYVIVKGDTLAKIAKKNSVTLKALEAANPNVQPTKLKVGQKLTIPAGSATAPAETPAVTATAGGGETYVVKSRDTLTKIAKAHGTTVKAIETENNLSTTKIKVGQKLKIPAKVEAAVTAPVEAPAPAAPAVAPVSPPPGTPAR